MASSSSRSRRNNTRARRDLNVIATSQVPRSPILAFSPVADRRMWSPYERPVIAWPRAASRIVPRSSVPLAYRSPGYVPSSIGFRVPKRVAICVRRLARRGVMFALGKAGLGGAIRKRSRRNFYSSVRC